MKNRANKNILKVKPYIPGKPIEEVKRELGLKSVIKLASNENPYGPSPKVLKAIAAEARNLNRYPDGSCFALRRELSKRLKVAPEQLVFGCGADETIVMAIRAFVEPGDEVIMARPSFLVYSIAATAAGAKVIEVPLRGLCYDLAAMKKAVTKKTKVVFIGNPDNPSGQYSTKAEIIELLDGFPQDVLVFFDEAYFEFAASQKEFLNILSVLKTRKNVVLARTFSKIYGLAGVRVGYAVTSPEVADLMERTREPFNVNSLAQVAAIAALKDEAYYRKVLREILREREVMFSALVRMGLAVEKSSTNFILIPLPKNGREVSAGLMRKGVIVRDMSVWGLQNYIRVTIGTPKENARFLKALKEVL